VQTITLLAKAKFASQEDEKLCLDTLRAERDAWNAASKVRFSLGKNNIVELHGNFYQGFRQARPDIPSQIVICAQRACLAGYKTVRSNRHNINAPIVKRGLSWQLDKRTYSWKKDGAFNFTTLGKRTMVYPRLYKRLKVSLEKHERCDPKLFARNGEVWIAYIFKVACPLHEGSVLGLDLGERNFITTSEGKIFRDKAYLKRKRKLRYLKRTLQGVAKKGSKSAKKKLKSLRRKEARMTKDFVNRATKELLKTDAKTIAIEDLSGIKKTSKNKPFRTKRKNNRASQVPYHLFRETLTYKAMLAGKRVVAVNPQYTSQIDHRSGRTEGCERRGRRFYGNRKPILDADVNAAINIAHRAAGKSANSSPKHPILSCKGLDGQVEVIDLSIACQPTNRSENSACRGITTSLVL